MNKRKKIICHWHRNFIEWANNIDGKRKQNIMSSF